MTDLHSRSEVWRLPEESSSIFSLDWSRDGRFLALGLIDGVTIWDLGEVGRQLQALGLDPLWTHGETPRRFPSVSEEDLAQIVQKNRQVSGSASALEFDWKIFLAWKGWIHHEDFKHVSELAAREPKQPKDWQTLLKAIRQMCEQVEESQQQQCVRVVNQLIRGNRSGQKSAEVIRLLELLRDYQVAHLGLHDESTLVTLSSLALNYRANGRAKEALPILEQVRDSQFATVGADHPATRATLYELAVAYGMAGEGAKSMERFEQLRSKNLALRGPAHFRTLATYNNLGVAYLGSGKVSEAIKIFEELRELQVTHLGVYHSSSIITLRNLALAYERIEKWKDVIPLYEQVLELGEAKADRVAIPNTQSSLAKAYLGAGNTAKAISLYEQLRDQRVKELGLDNSSTMSTLNRLLGN